MTLDELIALADSTYPDGLILRHWDSAAKRPVGQSRGDTLALFIASELHSTFNSSLDDGTQLEVAARALGLAASELRTVARALLAKGKRRRARGPSHDAPPSTT